MEIGRRSLFKTLLGGIAAASVLDPENLLWKAGERKIFVPPQTTLSGVAFRKDAFQMVCSTADFLKGDVVTISGKYKFDPYTRTETRELQQFVVTQDCMLADLKVRPFSWPHGEHAHVLKF